jgi:hypothetical protein
MMVLNEERIIMKEEKRVFDPHWVTWKDFLEKHPPSNILVVD